MGLFSKQACAFCGTEVGIFGRTSLASKDYICNHCLLKTNYLARMGYTTKDQAQWMMDNLAREEAEFEASFDGAQDRFESAERSVTSFHLGSRRLEYRCNTRIGAFQIHMDQWSRYEHKPVLWFTSMIPYEFRAEGEAYGEFRRMDIQRSDAQYAQVEQERDEEGKPKSCTLILPYDDSCIREIRIREDVSGEEGARGFYELAERINSDRRVWLTKADYQEQLRNRMHMRNLSDTVMAAAKAAATGADVQEAVKEGIETANAIERGEVRQSFWGKLFRKS